MQTKEFKLPDAGDIKCYDREGREVELTPEDELWGQNGCFVINPMSFTKLGNRAKVLPDSATYSDGYRMVLDNNTGLIWEIKSPKKTDINYLGDRYTWEEAKGYVKLLNRKKYAGFSDWRLPNKDELRSIVDYSRTNPAIDNWYFPDCQCDFYWTSVSYNMQRPFVWVIFFGLGSGICCTPTSKRCVRAVRGGYNKDFGKIKTARFQDNQDGTITDRLTGLMWQKAENERMDWYSALKSCKDMRLGRYKDWRLPNIKELNTILNLDYTDGWWYYKDFFPAEGLKPPLLHYFSSTPYQGIYVWVTNFCFGYDGYYASKNAKLLFRAVRNINQDSIQRTKKIFLFPDTGQKKCYDDTGKIIAIPKKRERFFGQDGSYVINPLSFTKMREYAKPIEDKAEWDNGLRMVKDNNTGLIWETKSPYKDDINYIARTYTWQEADIYIQQLNRQKYAGFSDWRLPHREELRTIVNYDGMIPAIDKKYFSDTLAEFYWCADENINDKIFAWGIYFAYGCAICYPKHLSYPVRAVRGGYNPNFGDPQKYAFRDNGDGTVTDLNTGLMWKKEESPELNWEEAMRYCQELDLAGYNDWYLPSIKEIATLIDLSFKDSCWYHKDFFPNVKTLPQGFYWASTTYADTFGWGVNFQFGYDGYYAGKREGRYPFRPVRRINKKDTS
ncbi:MAG: DUF1566 domain-containing protein [Candidatus Omnitrophica bacterium]|nr:DUF1566 domain-containing protein [Candidatus Omnitrophota bacterium]